MSGQLWFACKGYRAPKQCDAGTLAVPEKLGGRGAFFPWKGKRHLNGAEKTKGSKVAKICAVNKPVCKEKGRDADFALRTNLYVEKKEMQVLLLHFVKVKIKVIACLAKLEKLLSLYRKRPQHM